MDLQLEKQVVFVAGSSRGIGRSIAETLLAQGACVILTGRDEQSLRATCEEVGNPGNRDNMLAISGDFSKPAVIASGYERAAAHFGGIDHLVANLGTGSGEPGWTPSEAEWQRLFEQNFFASMRLTQSVLPYLVANTNGGSILYISSIAAIEASSAPLPYSAAKAALLNYSKNLARQLGPQKIRVNSIAPGNIWFPGGSWQKKLEEKADGVTAMLRADVPLQRFGTPAEVASLAAYLCSTQAAFCTGGCYVMDGGQTRTV
ncbi:MAG TPA: SDR family oxidoreductase [Steroidobacteraceae bacterium]|nr:SDR family oxidoreductase [Steroidobacteraceae bacterium]